MSLGRNDYRGTLKGQWLLKPVFLPEPWHAFIRADEMICWGLSSLSRPFWPEMERNPVEGCTPPSVAIRDPGMGPWGLGVLYHGVKEIILENWIPAVKAQHWDAAQKQGTLGSLTRNSNVSKSWSKFGGTQRAGPYVMAFFTQRYPFKIPDQHWNGL